MTKGYGNFGKLIQQSVTGWEKEKATLDRSHVCFHMLLQVVRIAVRDIKIPAEHGRGMNDECVSRIIKCTESTTTVGSSASLARPCMVLRYFCLSMRLNFPTNSDEWLDCLCLYMTSASCIHVHQTT